MAISGRFSANDQDVNETDVQSIDWSRRERQSNTLIRSSGEYSDDHKAEITVQF